MHFESHQSPDFNTAHQEGLGGSYGGGGAEPFQQHRGEPTVMSVSSRSALDTVSEGASPHGEDVQTAKEYAEPTDETRHVDTDAVLYYDPEWIGFSMNDIIGAKLLGLDAADLRADVAARYDVLQQAKDIGLTIVEQKRVPPNDSVEYTVRHTEIPQEQEEAELRAVVPDILIPETVGFAEFDAQPFFPVVAKSRKAQQGEYKYVLDTPDQWMNLRSILTGDAVVAELPPEDMETYHQEQARLETLEPGTDEYSLQEDYVRRWDAYVASIRTPFLGQGITGFLKYQHFIKTPSDHYTSFRVVAAATGDILASSLYYSAETKGNPEPVASKVAAKNLGHGPEGKLDHITSPHSPLYIAPRPFQSNNSRGGRGIVLDPTERAKPMNNTDREVAAAHGLNPHNPRLPQRLREMSAVIGRTFGRRLGIVVGIDWLQNRTDGTFHYLETNTGPGPAAFGDAYYGGTISEDEANGRMNKDALWRIALQHRRTT